MKGKLDIKSRTGRPGGSDCYIWVWQKDIAVFTEVVELYQTKEDNSKNLVGLHQFKS